MEHREGDVTGSNVTQDDNVERRQNPNDENEDDWLQRFHFCCHFFAMVVVVVFHGFTHL